MPSSRPSARPFPTTRFRRFHRQCQAGFALAERVLRQLASSHPAVDSSRRNSPAGKCRSSRYQWSPTRISRSRDAAPGLQQAAKQSLSGSQGVRGRPAPRSGNRTLRGRVGEAHMPVHVHFGVTGSGSSIGNEAAGVRLFLPWLAQRHGQVGGQPFPLGNPLGRQNIPSRRSLSCSRPRRFAPDPQRHRATDR